MIRAVLTGLATGAVLVAIGLVGSYLFYGPPVTTLANGDTVYDGAVILGLALFFGFGFFAGFQSVREQRRRRRGAAS